MKKIVLLMLSTNLIYAAGAGSRPAVSCADELEAVKKELEKAYQLIDDGWRQLLSVRAEIPSGKFETPHDVYEALEQPYKTLSQGFNKRYDMAWTPAENESLKSWNTIQKHMLNYSIAISEAPSHKNIWDAWGEQEWKQKEDIIGQKAGQGSIWKINKELGDFLVVYMGDYTDIRAQDRLEFVRLVGNVVPSLFGHGISLSKQTLKETLEKITKLAPKTGKVLQEKFNQRFGAPAASSRMAAGATPRR